jgi:hypothetical protein
MTDAEIAKMRNTSRRVVEMHNAESRRKLRTNTTESAAKIAARELGWPPSDRPSDRKSELSQTSIFPPAISHGLEQATETSALRDIGWNYDPPPARISPWPLRSRGARRNDLSISTRNLWIIAIAIGMPAVLVLCMMMGDYLGRLVAGISHFLGP